MANHSYGTDRAEQAYRRLRELIVYGRLAPGNRIVETEVAERLGVSRTPVRAALQRLEQEGYILSSGEGRSRASVAPLTREDARELFFIIGEIEGLAARWSAQVEAGDRAALLNELRSLNSELDREARSGRPSQGYIFDLDTRFHRTYVEAGAGPRLLALHDSIKPQAERYTRVYVSALIDEIHTSVQEHERIVEAIEAGRANEAQLAVQTNWRNAARRLGSVIDAVGERGSW